MEAASAFSALSDQMNALTTAVEHLVTNSEEQAMDDDLVSSLWLGIALVGLAPVILGRNCLVIAAFAIDRWVHDSLQTRFLQV